jgi:hypothetical protein
LRRNRFAVAECVIFKPESVDVYRNIVLDEFMFKFVAVSANHPPLGRAIITRTINLPQRTGK